MTNHKSPITNLQLGFTLIELLVVISIIGALASLFLISFVGVQKSGRDTQRKSDLKQYQTALEQFANLNNGFFPSRKAAGGVTAHTTLCADLSMTNCPKDPRYDTDTSYNYLYSTDGTSLGTVDATAYVLWGLLEKPDTDTYWVLCSDGKAGEVESGTSGMPPDSNPGGECPL